MGADCRSCPKRTPALESFYIDHMRSIQEGQVGRLFVAVAKLLGNGEGQASYISRTKGWTAQLEELQMKLISAFFVVFFHRNHTSAAL